MTVGGGVVAVNLLLSSVMVDSGCAVGEGGGSFVLYRPRRDHIGEAAMVIGDGATKS